MAIQNRKAQVKHLWRSIFTFLFSCLLRVLSVGPLPNHIAYIMDGNRRYAKKNNLDTNDRYRPGLLAIMSNIRHCYDLGIRYVTIYGFSIDNFRRHPVEVQRLMDILIERTTALLEEEDFMKKYGLRMHFIGNLALFSEEVQNVMKIAMEKTAENTSTFLIVCFGYTSSEEIVHAVQSCIQNRCLSEKIRLPDIEKEMRMSVAPRPDVLIRSAGETRLSNFLLWQTESCILYNPSALWPEIGLWQLVCAVISFQRHYSYLQKIRISS